MVFQSESQLDVSPDKNPKSNNEMKKDSAFRSILLNNHSNIN